MNPNAGRPYGGNRRVNEGSNRIEGQDKIEGVKLDVSSFKGRSDPDPYLTWEMQDARCSGGAETTGQRRAAR